MIDLAAAQGYRAIVFDRPGYGHSERPKGEKATPFVQARLIHGALKQLGAEKPVMVGHSWSGTMTLTYALTYPNEISGIVTLAAAMYKEGYPAENGDPISKLVATPVIGDLIVNTLLKSPIGMALAENMVKQTFAFEPIPADYREAALALWLRPGPFKANREDILAFSPAAEEISKRYKEIRTPVMIVAGTEHPFGTIEQALRLKEDIPHAKLKFVPNVAHMIPQNHPELVIEALNELTADNSDDKRNPCEIV